MKLKKGDVIMKKPALFTVLALCLSVLLLFGGCGGTATPVDTPSPSDTSATSATTTAPTPAPTAGPMTARGITDSELQAIEDFINEKENNGFVSHNYYSNPQEIDMGNVWYIGADIGIRSRDWAENEQELQDVLAAWGRDQIYTGGMKTKRKEMEDLLFRKTGTHFDLKNAKIWGLTYVEKYDAFYSWVSDSNYEEFDLSGGIVQENGVDTLYSVFYKEPWYEDYEVKITLRKVEGGYQFISSIPTHLPPGKLNADNIQKLQTFLQKKSTAAFLGPNEYENTYYIDLVKVFDDGAGLTMIHPFENWSIDLKEALFGTADWTNEDIQAFGINPMEANDLLKKYTNRDLTRNFLQKIPVGSYTGGDALLECSGYGHYFVFCPNPPESYVPYVSKAELKADGTLTVRYSDGTENGAVYEVTMNVLYRNSKFHSPHCILSNKQIR